MRITENGHIELTLDEFIILARVHIEGGPSIPKVVVPRGPRPPQAAQGAKKHRGRQPQPRIDWKAPGNCPIHRRAMVKDPETKLHTCPKCLDAEDASAEGDE